MGKKQLLIISSQDDADKALQRIGQLTASIAGLELDANKKLDEIREQLVKDSAEQREALAINEAALEAWATKNKAELFTEPRSLELNWGTVGFRLTPWKILTIGRVKTETIIEKIRAAKLTQLIRPKYEIDRKKALNYSAEDLARCGLRKKQSDEFFYETNGIEVK